LKFNAIRIAYDSAENSEQKTIVEVLVN